MNMHTFWFCLIVLVLLIAYPLPTQSQLATNAPPNTVAIKDCRPLTSKETKYLRSQGIDPSHVKHSIKTNLFGAPPTAAEANWFRSQGIDPKHVLASFPDNSGTPGPPELKNAMICLDSFMVGTNTIIAADVISMDTDSLKFYSLGKTWDYSGHYTVVPTKPRAHKKPYFGFGSVAKASFVFLDNFGGTSMPLSSARILEKRRGFIDVEAGGREWIHSGGYTIRSQ